VLMNRFARDSRKWNVRVLLSSQIPADFLKIQGFVSLLDSVFVGRLDDEHAQADALRLLKVPVGAGYEQVVAALGRRPGGHRGTERDRAPRQFIFGDGAGGVERIRVDFSGPHLSHLVSALDTTPDAQRSDGSAAAGAGTARPPALPPAPAEVLEPGPDQPELTEGELEFDEFELDQGDPGQRAQLEAGPNGQGGAAENKNGQKNRAARGAA
jgi:hypothetical protein